MKITTRNIKDLELTNKEIEMAIYNNLEAVKKLLCMNLGENISTCRNQIKTLEKYIFN